MPEMFPMHEPLLVNTLGHLIGALIFAIFVYLLLKDRSRSRLRESHLSIAAGTLAFLWNFASLMVLAVPRSMPVTARLVYLLASAALALLPAVLLHVSVARRYRVIVALGYAVSVAAVLIHAAEPFQPAGDFHRYGFLLLAGGFGFLSILSAVLVLCSGEQDHRRLTSQVLGALSLFLLSLSFVHYSYATGSEPWPLEMAMHHAVIPLALLVLLQDFRFVLLDAFVRFTANIMLAAGLTVVGLKLGEQLAELPIVLNEVLAQAFLLLLACLLLILFAMVRGWVQKTLTHLVFGRADLENTLQRLRAREAAASNESEFLEWAGHELADFMKTEQAAPASGDLAARLLERGLLLPVRAESLAELRDDLVAWGAEAVVPVRISHGEVVFVLLGRRRGGRPYLSEDLQALGRLAAEIGEHIERIRESEIRRLVSQAELRALQSQIHPHFLFNALNTLYGVIPKEAGGARRTVLNLADIFRYFLQTEKTYIPLEDELNIVRAYLEIEGLRLGPKLRTEIEVDPEALRMMIPILTVEPLVENAVKHGVASKPEGGTVWIEARLRGGCLAITVADSGAGFQPGGKRQGVGLDNVLRRLKLCYGPDSGLEIQSDATGARVRFVVPLSAAQGVAS